MKMREKSEFQSCVHCLSPDFFCLLISLDHFGTFWICQDQCLGTILRTLFNTWTKFK